MLFDTGLIYFDIYLIYMVQRRPPPPPVDGSWSPPLWLWGCGGALLVSDAADFLWFLVPPPPLWMCGWVMVPPPVVVGLWWGSACF